MSSAGYPLSEFLSNEITRLYFEEYLSLSGVATQLQIGRHTVERRLEESGRKLRSPREGARLALAKYGSPAIATNAASASRDLRAY